MPKSLPRAVLATGILLLGLTPLAARADELPPPLGECIPGSCPDPFPWPPNNGPIAGRDDAINVFAGGDFDIRGGAAEAEGRVVVMGDLSMDKTSGSTVYDIGLVGVGSQVPPSDGEDFLVVGNDIDVAAGETLMVGGVSAEGIVLYGGALTGTGSIDAVQPGNVVQDPDASLPYSSIATELASLSECYAEAAVTGTAENQDSQTLFTGDGSSLLQVFSVDFDLETGAGGDQAIEFAGIPADATVLVNITGGPTREIRTYSGGGGGSWDALRERVLFNFVDATDVLLTGPGSFQGSTILGQAGSSATVEMPGINGRFYTPGDLTHQSRQGGGGEEFHDYPFRGDALPVCSSAPTTSTEAPTTTGSEAAPSDSGRERELAFTGKATVVLSVIGLSLVLAGLAMLRSSRRRSALR